MSSENETKGKVEVFYFKNELTCGVCRVLGGKIEQMLAESFPKFELCVVDTVTEPEKAASYGVFSVPVVLLYIDGKEYIREVGNISVYELKSKFERYNNLLNS
ncbi:MAG: thioredoxin family protein [Lentimicrobiaceae bacterium]|nr:thioredoxin family protein [Lentimicrobiaceae bacterium]